MNQQVQTLLGLAVAAAAGKEDDFRYYYRLARRLGVSDVDLFEATTVALVAAGVPAREMKGRVEHLLVDVAGAELPPVRSCCG